MILAEAWIVITTIQAVPVLVTEHMELRLETKYRASQAIITNYAHQTNQHMEILEFLVHQEIPWAINPFFLQILT